MKHQFRLTAQLIALSASTALVLPAWHAHFYASSCLLAGLALACTITILLTQYTLQQRPTKRVEHSVVAPKDRETIRNRALLNHVPVPLLFRTIDGTLHTANRSARQLFGTEGHLLNPPNTLLSALDTQPSSPNSKIIRITSSMTGISRLYTLSISTGNHVGGITHYIALTDIEAGLNAAEAQALRDMLHILSHEIMNSLTPIVSLSATAKEFFDEPYSPETQTLIADAISTIKRRAEGLDNFVQGYRNLARLPTPQLKPLNLGQLLQETAKIFDARWQGRVSLEVSLPVILTTIQLDQAQMEQALLNILNNAAEATLEHAEPRVHLSAEATTNSAHIFIQDNGHGIPPEQEETIFHPFVSLKHGGNGIGLTLARQIILGHGGSLILDKKHYSNKWTTTFKVSI
ncbi:sensor histidine kinase [Neokomagataea anthophila]|uniref:histidine kinase n=1 Tax=Neokomagataea anthophila TaxID=2826925 RepID=A0ABS5E7F1_9PROT|nr:HAMP domain-containing sensor histidine kinase [Neokomagataea anthophila]MBR0559832.1 HAMP domain-containing histidine kinase [Neokomagataea anthophila]